MSTTTTVGVIAVLVLLPFGAHSDAGGELAQSTQIYDIELEGAIDGVTATLEDMDVPVLVVDQNDGIVVSGRKQLAPPDLRAFGQMDADQNGTYNLVVYFDRTESDKTRISIVTIVRRRSESSDRREAGCYISGNVLSGRLFEKLTSRFGSGLLIPVGE